MLVRWPGVCTDHSLDSTNRWIDRLIDRSIDRLIEVEGKRPPEPAPLLLYRRPPDPGPFPSVSVRHGAEVRAADELRVLLEDAAALGKVLLHVLGQGPGRAPVLQLLGRELQRQAPLLHESLEGRRNKRKENGAGAVARTARTLRSMRTLSPSRTSASAPPSAASGVT